MVCSAMSQVPKKPASRIDPSQMPRPVDTKQTTVRPALSNPFLLFLPHALAPLRIGRRVPLSWRCDQSTAHGVIVIHCRGRRQLLAALHATYIAPSKTDSARVGGL